MDSGLIQATKMRRDKIESISVSLVREYLSRKGFRQTLKMLDSEFPRTEDSINNRLILAKEMHIERLMRKNKAQLDPFRTMVEVLVLFMLERAAAKPEQVSKTSDSSTVWTSFNSQQRLKRSSSLQDVGGTKSSSSDYTSSIDIPSVGDGKRCSNDSKAKITNNIEQADAGKLEHVGNSNGYRNSTERRDKLESMPSGHHSTSIKQTDESSGWHLSKHKKHLSSPIISTVDKKQSPKGKKKSIDLNFVEMSGHHVVDPKREELNFQAKTINQEKTPQRERQKVSDDTQSQKQAKKSVELNSRRKNGEMVFDDIEDDIEEELSGVSLGQHSSRKFKNLYSDSKPITLDIAMELKSVIFGSAMATLKAEWLNQSLSFCDLPNLGYGIVQLKGGPCGVLAAIQAIFLKFLLFEREDKRKLRRPPEPTSEEITFTLANVLADVLWKAGTGQSATISIPTRTTKFSGGGRYKCDGLTETLTLNTFLERSNLVAFIAQNINLFQDESSPGCVLLLYSAVLSRGLKRVKSDMDDVSCSLIGSHGYCTQELVNLLLCGNAASNVFDGILELDSGGPVKSLLKGIGEQCDIGFLSLFEHYGSCKVGDNYKNPRFPIWVVCSESHFSVLFSTNFDPIDSRSKRHFDLYYYDGLARQEEEIRLTVDFTKPWKYEENSDDLIPPLELCIRTKWPNSSISWNGTEPIL